MSAFSVTRAISFYPPVFSVGLYHCPIPYLKLRSNNFVTNGSIAVDYLEVGASHTAEAAVATSVVMAPMRAVRNAESTYLGVTGAVASSSLPAFTATSSGAFLSVRLAIIQSS